MYLDTLVIARVATWQGCGKSFVPTVQGTVVRELKVPVLQ